MKVTMRPLGIVVLLALVASLLPTAPLSASGPADAVLIRMAADAYATARAEGVNASYATEYGPFVWLELGPADLARLQASGLAYELYAEPYVLDLGGRSFDPLRAGDGVADGWQAGGGEGADLHLVQLRSPARAEWLAELERGGLEIVQYVHPFTYIVWGDEAGLARASAAEFVRWTGAFAPAYRVLPRWRDLPGEAVRADVLLYRGADVEAALAQIQALGAERQGYAALNGTFATAAFTLPGTALQAAARIAGVYSIQLEPTDGGLRGEMSNQVNANNVDGSNAAFPGYLTWLASVGVDGTGVTMANVDGGVQDTHPDLVNRIVGCTGTTCGGGASSSHGTHTAGIMAADGSSGVTDVYGFLRGLGMAPAANLVEQVYSPYFTYPGGMLMLMTDSYNNGASLSGNSWGPSGSPLGYDDDTMQVDIGVRDADPNTAGNQPLSYILSFMNGNGGYQTQGTPDEAKNIFTIGSTKMQTSSGAQILQIDDLSSNTAHGPALDGRTIPHMVAPGCSVDSTVPTNSYGLMCGTSMASPHVSGAVALFIEYYRNLTGSDPSPALIKAAYLPVAHDLAGHLDADGAVLGHPFDAKQGWGRMDTEAVVDPQVAVVYYDDPLVLDNTGEVWAETLQAADPSEPVRLMLVWTDAPGHGLGGSTPAWNNDLDLAVTVGGDSYLGNNFGSDGWSQTGGLADWMNNTEGVFLPPGTTGGLHIEVVASNINSDGIPNQGDSTDQDFALVCYNCMSQADFTLAVTPDSYEVCAPETVSGTVEIGEILDFTETVSLSVTNLPAGVQVNLVPAAVVPPASVEMGLEVSGAAAEGDYSLVLSGTAGSGLAHTTTITLRVNSGVPAAPAPLAPAHGALNVPPEAVDFGWQAVPLASGYRLEVDVDPAFASPIFAASGLASNSYLLTDTLQPASRYFWQVAAENSCGVGDWSLAHFGTMRRGAMLWDDVEAGGGNWTATGLWHVTTNPTDPCAKAHSGSSSWYYGREPECDYDAGENSGTLTLNSPVDLSGAGAPVYLRFWSWEQTENYLGVDRRRVYLSDDGNDWTMAWNSSNNDSAWYPVEIDASTYAGGPLYLRFEFDTRDAYSNNYRGWYVDDVELVATLPPLAGPEVIAVTPGSGPLGVAVPITIKGLNFTPSPMAMLGDVFLPDATFVNSETLTATVPASLITGTYDLMVINNDGQSDTMAEAYLVGPVRPTQLFYLPLIFK